MNNKGTKEQSFGLELQDWKRVRVPADVERLAKAVVDAALAVHSELGPGLLESAYETCLSHELRLRGVNYQLQLPVPLDYEGIRIEVGYRADVVVEEKLLGRTESRGSIAASSHRASNHLSPAQKVLARSARQFQRSPHHTRHSSRHERAAFTQ